MKRIAISLLILAQLDGLAIRFFNLSLWEGCIFLALLIVTLSVFGVTAPSLFTIGKNTEKE